MPNAQHKQMGDTILQLVYVHVASKKEALGYHHFAGKYTFET